MSINHLNRPAFPAIIISPDNPERDLKLYAPIYLLDAPPEPYSPPQPNSIQCFMDDVESCKPKVEACARFKARGVLLVPREMPPFGARLRRVPYKQGKPVSCRIMIEFTVKAKLNLDLWKKLKVPPPWKKSPRHRFKNDSCYPVRLYSYQPAELSKEQVDFLHAQIALMELASV
jgi:hypothetical protein